MTKVNKRGGEKILVLGAGNFGTCLAQHLAEKGYHVTMWTRSAAAADAINSTHRNPKYLTTVNLSPRLSATSKITAELMAQVSVVVLATPTQTLREVLGALAPHWRPALLLICAAKGIEMGTLQLPDRVIAEVLGEEAAGDAVFLSGPSFAVEIVSRQPTAVSVASLSATRAHWAQELFHAAHFRVYTSDDPVGLEVAGALKNVVAIAAGASQGIGFQANSRAALITRGLAEITRVGVALGANPITFKGMGGVGDLFLTCTSEKSRNFTVGFRLGKGEALESVLASLSVAEGVTTAKAAYALAQKLGVEAPITTEVYRVLYEGKPITQAVMDLLTREAKPEFDQATR
jgi:glycerol-3-phosphate dehydrogenase (NAD(P)+)